jgi:hypothetical protein
LKRSETFQSESWLDATFQDIRLIFFDYGVSVILKKHFCKKALAKNAFFTQNNANFVNKKKLSQLFSRQTSFLPNI